MSRVGLQEHVCERSQAPGPGPQPSGLAIQYQPWSFSWPFSAFSICEIRQIRVGMRIKQNNKYEVDTNL